MRHPSCQDGTRPATHPALPTTAGLARGLLFVHLVLSPLLFSRLTTEAFESNKVALLLLTALALTALGLWAGVSWALTAPAAERRGAPRRFVGELARDPLALAFVLFAASAAVSTATSISPWTSLLGAHESYAGLGTVLGYVVLFFATRAACRGPADAWRLLAAGVIAAAVAAAYAVLQFARLDPMRWGEVSAFAGFSRPFATMGHANILAAYLVTALPVVAVFAARAGAARAFGPLAVLAGVAGLGLTAVLLTLSRGAWLGLACAAAFLAAYAWRAGRRRGVLLTGAALLGAAALLTAGPGAAGRSDLWRSAAARVRHLADASGRRAIWSAGLKMLRDRPLTGCGPDAFQLAFPPRRTAAYWRQEWNQTPARAHNEVIHVLATQGAPGGAALLLGLAGLVVAAARAWRRQAGGGRVLVAGACAGVLAFCVQDLFNFTLAPVGTLFVTLAAVLSALGRPGAEAAEGPGGTRGFAVLLGLSALAAVLPVALNAAPEPGAGTWYACCGLLAVTAGAAAWAVARLEGAGAAKIPAVRHAPTSRRILWAARAAILAGTVVLAVKWVVEPYRAAVACRDGDAALAAGDSAVGPFRCAAALAPHQEVYRVRLGAAALADARRAVAPAERASLFRLARQATEEALRLAPSSATDHLNRGAVLTEMAMRHLADPDEALAELDRATATDPNNAYLLAGAGQSALSLGRPASARDYFTRGLASDPDYAPLWSGLGRVALAGKRFGEAITLLERAEHADWHGDQEALYDSVQARAFAYLGGGFLAPAEEAARYVAGVRPDRPEPRLIRARACELLGQTAEALEEYRKALALAPDNVAAGNGVRRLQAVVAGGRPR